MNIHRRNAGARAQNIKINVQTKLEKHANSDIKPKTTPKPSITADTGAK
jgi:hypothetical protein